MTSSWSHLETLENTDVRVPNPGDADVIGLGYGVGQAVVSCPAPHCLPMYEGEMRQWVSNSFGSKYRCYLAHLEKNTNFRTPLAQNSNQIVKCVPEPLYEIKTKSRPKKMSNRCLGDVEALKVFLISDFEKNIS